MSCPSFRALQAELQQADATINILKGALAASVADAINVPTWAAGLTRQQGALMGALIAKYPQHMSRQALCSCIPHRDHTLDCDEPRVRVLMSMTRNVLGKDTFETQRGVGVRVSPAFMARIGQHAES